MASDGDGLRPAFPGTGTRSGSTAAHQLRPKKGGVQLHDQRGEVTDELRDAMADNVPLVFSTLIALTIPFMVWLPIFKPF